MQVTKANIVPSYNEFISLLPTAEFVSIDLEMTGLYPSTQPRATTLDTIEERYASMRTGSTEFTILQLGISLAHRQVNEADGTYQYMYTPFNIYTWPASFSKHHLSSLSLDKPITGGGSSLLPGTLKLDIDAIEYNRDHYMDFNQWINSGVPYWKNQNLQRIEAYFEQAIQGEEEYQHFNVYTLETIPKFKTINNLKSELFKTILF
jgi:hypothetical protein